MAHVVPTRRSPGPGPHRVLMRQAAPTRTMMMPAIVIEPIEPSIGRSKAPSSFVYNRNHRDNRGRAGGQGTRTSRAASGTRFSTVLGGAAAQLTALVAGRVGPGGHLGRDGSSGPNPKLGPIQLDPYTIQPQCTQTANAISKRLTLQTPAEPRGTRREAVFSKSSHHSRQTAYDNVIYY